LLTACTLTPPQPSPYDNVLLIVADDISMERIGAYARRSDSGPTPTLDLLASKGVRFSRAYSNPVCSPTRATILTGLYGFRTGIGDNINYTDSDAFELRQRELTLADVLAPTHRTAAIGKWHLASRQGFGVRHPIAMGFETFAGTLGQLGGMQSDPQVYSHYVKTVTTTNNSRRNWVDNYCTTEQVDDAMAFIDESGARPWFLYLAFNAPHTPFHVPPDDLTTLAVNDDSPPPTKHRAMVEAMDTEIGRLIRSIPLEVLLRTWVVFVGDNGSHGLAMSDPVFRNKGKSTLFEGGINVPLIMGGPGVVEGGRDVDAVVNTTDLFMTVLDMAGVELPEDSRPCDSISLMPYLRDPEQSPRRRAAYSEYFTPNGFGPRTESMHALIGSRYKLLLVKTGAESQVPVMFDLRRDPGEDKRLFRENASPEERAVFRALGNHLLKLLKSRNGPSLLAAPLPTPEAPADPPQVD
jgi:arylsulfatase A-like enzyme